MKLFLIKILANISNTGVYPTFVLSYMQLQMTQDSK